MAYKNLRKELKARGLSDRAAASVIGMNENTFRDKIAKGNFLVGEAFTILSNLFPMYNIEYLFEEDEDDSEPDVMNKAS